MTPDQADSIVAEARTTLIEYREMREKLPAMIRVAYRLGIRKTEITELSGLARSTIDRYLGHQPKRGTHG